MPVQVPAQYVPWIEQASQQTGVPAALLAAQEQVESGFNPRAVSPAGAIGIAQFMPATAAALGVNPWDPQSSIFGQARYMRQLFDQFGNWTQALEAYNVGPAGNLQSAAGYAAEVENLANQLAAQFSGGQLTVAGAGPSGSPGRCTPQGWVDQPCGAFDPGCAVANWWGAFSCNVGRQLSRLAAGIEIVLGLTLIVGGGLVMAALVVPQTEIGRVGSQLIHWVAKEGGKVLLLAAMAEVA